MVSLVNVRIQSDSPQISASPHQLDFAPYASRSYSAQWNVSELLHDMHMLRSSRILGKMEVEESLIGLRLPLHYRADTGVSQHTTLELG